MADFSKNKSDKDRNMRNQMLFDYITNFQVSQIICRKGKSMTQTVFAHCLVTNNSLTIVVHIFLTV